MPASPGPSTPPLPDPRRHQLENGVSLVQIELPEAPVVCLDLWCRAGSACETEAESGLAHFLEHMVFKGSEQLEAGEFDLKVEALGGNSNAATGFDDVHYHVLIPPQAATQAVDLLLDLVLQPRLDGGDFAMERQVVLEELAQSEDQPDEIALQQLLRLGCPGHAYGEPILGRRELLAAAREACARREAWSPYPEMPERYPDAEAAQARGRARRVWRAAMAATEHFVFAGRVYSRPVAGAGGLPQLPALLLPGEDAAGAAAVGRMTIDRLVDIRIRHDYHMIFSTAQRLDAFA